MSRCIASLIVVGLLASAAGAAAQKPNVVSRQSVMTATVERIERSSRVVNVRGDANQVLSVYVDPSVAAFDELKTGDVVTVRYEESVVVQVRPGAALSDPHDTTAQARKAGNAQVVEQQTAVVTIEEIDPHGQSVTYRTAGGLKAMRPVQDKRLLEGLHSGDRIEVTLTRARAVAIERRR